jgi:secondary thiamine-phosphate synthase enzyme
MEFTIKTHAERQIVDITSPLAKHIKNQSITEAIAVIVVKHTTASITTADLDPGTDLDFLDFLSGITPVVNWRHPHNPTHAPAHLLSSLIGTSIVLSITKGSFSLGSWQRIVLVELDGPRERTLSFSLLPTVN